MDHSNIHLHEPFIKDVCCEKSCKSIYYQQHQKQTKQHYHYFNEFIAGVLSVRILDLNVRKSDYEHNEHANYEKYSGNHYKY